MTAKVTVVDYSKYTVDENGVVTDRSGSAMEPYIDSNGLKRILLRGDNGKETRPFLARLVLRSFRPLDQDIVEAYMSGIHLDGDKLNCSIHNLKWSDAKMIPPTPKDDYEFFPIPGYSLYKINKAGQIQLRFTNKPVSYYSPESTYHRVSIVNDKSVRSNVGIHRLLALTFLEHPYDTYHLIINHKDGNPANNKVENLEWVTHTDNINHAYYTGLRSETRKIKLMNPVNREVIVMASLNDAARFLKCNPGALHGVINDRKMTQRSYRGFYIKYEDDNTDWPDSDVADGVVVWDGIAVEVTDITTGQTFKFKSYSEAGRIICDNPNNMFARNYALGIRKKPYKGKYTARLIPDGEVESPSVVIA